MKKRIFLFTLLAVCFTLLFAIGVSAATTNEFGTVETSTKIDLTDMSTDANARVVLFDGTEYHTYPAQYIVTNATDITFNFDKINEAFEKSYVNNSVIRIEIPNTVKVIVSGVFNYGKNNNLKEVYFPSDSKVYKFNWGCFEQNTGIEKINIPASLTEYDGTNHFAKCTSLKEVTFDEGYSVSSIPNNFLQSCSSLTEIVFPNSVTHIGGGAFSSCAKLKKIVLGASLQTMDGAMSDCATSGSTWYLPATFYASSVESNPPSNMFHWAGNKTDGVSGNNNNPKNITFVFTGTKAQAEALRARFKAADEATGENCIGLSRIYDATLCTEAEYFELTGKKVGEIATGYYFVYGYSQCDAFYNGEHGESVTEKKFESTEYFTPYMEYKGCNRCTNKTETELAGALFTSKGFSTDGNSFMFEIRVNKDAIAKYVEKTGKTVKYGIVASQIYNDGALLNENGAIVDNRVIAAEFTDQAYTILQIKIVGVEAEEQATLLHCCAYVVDDNKVKYLYDYKNDKGETVLAATDYANQVSYSQIK